MYSTKKELSVHSSERHDFARLLFQLALPITIQAFIQSSLNLIDNVMVGQMGEMNIAAVGLANQVFMIFAVIISGLSSACSIFFAQLWGKKDIEKIKSVLGLSLSLSLLVSTVFCILNLIHPYFAMSIFSKDPQVIEVGGQYLRINAFGFIMMALSVSYSTALKSMERIRVTVIAAISALFIKTLMNYCLIFGNLGLPKLGVNGAATATLIARASEAAILITIIYACKFEIGGNIKGLFRYDRELSGACLKKAAICIGNDATFIIGTSLYKVIYARLGTEVIASVSIQDTIISLAWIFMMGVGYACSVMVGKKIGENQMELAQKYARRFILIAVSIGLSVGLVILAVNKGLVSLFKVSPNVHDNAVKLIYVVAAVMVFKCLNGIIKSGILRSGGDVMYAVMIDFIGIFIVGLPLCYLGGFIWKLPVWWVFALACMEEVCKVILAFQRYLAKRWVRNLVGGSTPAEPSAQGRAVMEESSL